jgi:MFS family permease
MTFSIENFLNWLPKLDHRIWILIAGRSLSQLGTGFILFYAPIFFVNKVALSATAVGIGIGSGSISGIFGRILGGSFADSPHWGRRWTLLLSAIISALADLVLVMTHDLPTFILGNLLMGLGTGLYWPATEAVVADLTTVEQRHEAFALTRLGDSLGLGLGVVLGGVLINLTGNYRALFVIDGISFLMFFGIIYWAIAETFHPDQARYSIVKGWITALGDRTLLIYVLVNILFTIYQSQIHSALPLYFSNFIPLQNAHGFSTSTISSLFSWHVVLAALTQLPVARALRRFSHPQALMVSALLWGIGFILTWFTGISPLWHLVWAMVSLGVLAIATVAYMPSASALVVTLAPLSLRGVYLSINSLCWAVGYFIGPTFGGWAMDQTKFIADSFWVASTLSVGIGLLILQILNRIMRSKSVVLVEASSSLIKEHR